ncbi:MAG: hypothetical protein VX982_03540 [Chloroflexota bacterium]|nr:hypothetical protein [Chloroflexota bacterium]
MITSIGYLSETQQAGSSTYQKFFIFYLCQLLDYIFVILFSGEYPSNVIQAYANLDRCTLLLAESRILASASGS